MSAASIAAAEPVAVPHEILMTPWFEPGGLPLAPALVRSGPEAVRAASGPLCPASVHQRSV